MLRPRIPDWIRTYVPPRGWTNVFALVPSNDHLYGTETLLGDWHGQTLLLAKDGAPTSVIRALLDKGDPRPWRHAQRELRDAGGYKTNESIASAAALLPGGKLYGSATANLLCDDPRWSRSLPGFYTEPLAGYLRRVLAWVLGSMPNVQRIACLGQEAWYLTSTVLGQMDSAREFAQHRDSRTPLFGACDHKRLSAFALYHPAARVSADAKQACWAAMLGGTKGTAVLNGATATRGTETREEMHTHKAAPAGADGPIIWTDLPPSPTARRARPVGIRKEMLAILKTAGEKGVLSQGFAHLDWRDGFRKDKLWKAMGYLADDTGSTLQYEGKQVGKTYPFRWRIKP